MLETYLHVIVRIYLILYHTNLLHFNESKVMTKKHMSQETFSSLENDNFHVPVPSMYLNI